MTDWTPQNDPNTAWTIVPGSSTLAPAVPEEDGSPDVWLTITPEGSEMTPEEKRATEAATAAANRAAASEIIVTAGVTATAARLDLANSLLVNVQAVETDLDAQYTLLNSVQAAVAADRVQTGLDRVATAADRVQTGLDRTGTGQDKAASQTARTGAETAQTAAETARTGAETAQTGAQTARTGAETARDLALGYRDAAATHATNAGTSETNALASKNAANTSAGNAATSEANALGYRNAASGYATDALGYRNAAQAAAAVAVRYDTAQALNTGQQAQARSNIALGNSATRDVGTTAGTVAAGDDARFTSGSFIRYDAAQSLTGAQSAQGRSNLALGDAATHPASDFMLATGGQWDKLASSVSVAAGSANCAVSLPTGYRAFLLRVRGIRATLAASGNMGVQISKGGVYQNSAGNYFWVADYSAGVTVGTWGNTSSGAVDTAVFVSATTAGGTAMQALDLLIEPDKDADSVPYIRAEWFQTLSPPVHQQTEAFYNGTGRADGIRWYFNSTTIAQAKYDLWGLK